MKKEITGSNINSYTIYPGEHFAAAGPGVITTVTGPFMAVCLYEQEKKIGGMGHFFVPGKIRISSAEIDEAWIRGVGEMECLMGEIVKQGGDRKRLLASVFGAALVPVDEVPGFDDMLLSNMHFIREYFVRENIPVVTDGLGGITYKKITFDIGTGGVHSAILTDPKECSVSRRRDQKYILGAVNNKSSFGKVILFDTATYESLIGLIPDIVYRIDQDGYFRYVSDSIFKLGYEPLELIGKHYSVIIHPDDRGQVQRDLVLPQCAGVVTGAEAAPKLFDERRTGSRITRNLKVRLLPRPGGGDAGKCPIGEVICTGHYEDKTDGKSFQGSIGIIRDITDVMSAARALELTERFYRTILNGSSDMFSMLFTDGTILYISEAVNRTTGHARIDLIGENLCDFTHPDDLPQTRTILDAASGAFYGNLVEHRFKHSDGHWIVFESTVYKVIDNEKNTIINILHSRDITRRTMAEERLQSVIVEKEVLLKEVHHRVKNNLQVIISLLELQSKQIKDKSVRGYLRESQNRIHAIALIHEKAYGSNDFSRVAFDKYLHSIVSDLFLLFECDDGRFTLDIAADPVEMNIGMAIPFGIIINEVVTNTIKYAFPPGFAGDPRISISLKNDSNGRVTLEINDNGVGIPAHIDPDTTESLGLYLIKSISTGQLKGTCDIANSGGTRITVSFQNR